jgi:hypothetical protein
MPTEGPCQDINLMLHDVPWLKAHNFQKPQGIMHDTTRATRTYTKKKKPCYAHALMIC